MTPKEKAKEIYDKFKPLVSYYDRGSEEPVSYEHLNIKSARESATICVKEVISAIRQLSPPKEKQAIEEWQEVLNHIKTMK